MATASTDSVDVPIISDEDEKFGFRRKEMYESNLAGTVNPYERHVFLCHKSPEAWVPRVEGAESDPLPKLFAGALKARKDEFPVKTLLTICEGRNGGDFSEGDVLIFPELIKYKGLKESDVDSFVADVLVNQKPWASGVQEVLSGSYVFVCSHGSRDKRCGVCGPVLIAKFKEQIDLRGLGDQVFVSPCSHIGGHKYAGNLIIYSPGPDGKIAGHWYGYVTPNDVPELLDENIAKGKIIERLWRGQMGVPAEEGEKSEQATEQKLPNGEDIKKSEKPKEGASQDSKENFSGCCQGANGGFTCCRDGSFEQTDKSEEKKLEASGKEGPLCKLTSWIGSLEQRDVLATAAVVSALVTVAVAYSYYRRSH